MGLVGQKDRGLIHNLINSLENTEYISTGA